MNNNYGVNNQTIFRNYKRIELDISVLKTALKMKRDELVWAIELQAPMDVKGIDYSKDSFGGKKVDSTMSQLLNIANLKHEIENIESHLKKLEVQFKEMQEMLKEKVKEMNDLELKVFFKRFVEGKKYSEIANELVYNENYIRHVACKINNL